MTQPLASLLLLVVALLLTACADGESPGQVTSQPPPFVKVVHPRPTDTRALNLSGEIRARYETPLSFQVSGRILERKVDSGMSVTQGQTLFRLDARDLEENLRAARAELAAAESALALAQSDLERDRKLLQENHISRQAVDRQELVTRESRTRLDATQAQVELARNALQYAELNAPADGVLTRVDGEAGQVVNAGQTVASLAYRAEREVEVYLPEGVEPPESGRLVLRNRDPLAIRLREVAGSVDALSRTLRTRYTIEDSADNLYLGSIVRVGFQLKADQENSLVLPVGALAERGEGAFVWQVVEGQARSVPVTITHLDRDHVQVLAKLTTDASVVAMGTHLLREGMAVRELER